MFRFRYLLNPPIGLHDYIWMNVSLIRETKKAILIMFDNRQEWLPKAWILGIKHPRHCEERRRPRRSDRGRNVRGSAALSVARPISIKISRYHWAKKFE